MANYDVTFQTDWDTSTNGRKGSRRFDVEARSPREAAMLGFEKLTVLAVQGYIRIGDPERLVVDPDVRIDMVRGVRGEVERDTYRGAANTQVAGSRNTFGVRRGGYNPRWSLLVKQGTGVRFNLEFILEKVE